MAWTIAYPPTVFDTRDRQRYSLGVGIPPGGIIMRVEVLSYSVPGMSCEHCRSAVSKEVGAVPGVESVEVDLTSKLVTVHGAGVSDAAVREAIDEAGYDVAEAAV
jgi:copper chaperone CopZ